MRVDVGANLALRPDRQAVVLELDRAADLAFDEQVLFAAHVAVDVNRRADDGRFAADGALLLRGGLDSVLAGLDSGRGPASGVPFLPISNMMIP